MFWMLDPWVQKSPRRRSDEVQRRQENRGLWTVDYGLFKEGVKVLPRDNLIEEIGQRSDLVSLISEYVPLKKAGKNYKGLCPFHSERTPSFIVSPEKQLWHCFGCGAGGNVFSFLMKIENLSFLEAAKALAQRAGVKWQSTPQSKGQDELRERLFKVNDFALSYFHDNLFNLKRGKLALSYLKERGLDKKVMEEFKLGFALPEWDSLLKEAQKKGFLLSDLEKLGLLSARSGQEGYYDNFRHRVIFPILDTQERVVGFGGRSLGQEEPKYLNSRESLVFNKSRSLFGLNLAKQEISKQGLAIIVEGYMDVIAAFQFGKTNVVASMGTSLTPEQARLLSRYTNSVVIAYDPDLAGRMASKRGLDLLSSANLKVKVAVLPEGKDPDELIRESGVKLWEELVKDAKSLIDYKIDLILSHQEIKDVEDKAQVAEEIVRVLEGIKNPVVLDGYLKLAAQRLQVDESAIRSLKAQLKISYGKKVRKFASPISGQKKIEREMLHLMVENKAALEAAKMEILPSDFTDPTFREIAEVLFRLSEDKILKPQEILNCLDEEKTKETFTEVSLGEFNLGEVSKEVIRGYLNRLKQQSYQIEFKKIEAALEKAEKEGDYDRSRELAKDFLEYRKKIGKLVK